MFAEMPLDNRTVDQSAATAAAFGRFPPRRRRDDTT
jgi:hypothetical protein